MKLKKLCFALAALMIAALAVFPVTVYAEGEFTEEPYAEEPVYTEPYEEPTDPAIEPETSYEEYTEPVYTEPFEPQTEPETETEYVAPVTEEATEPPTVFAPPATEYQAQNANEPTYFEPPQVPKTISVKTYSTNYAAGIVSWICVGVGLVVVAVVLISTKLSGRRTYR